MADDKKKGDEGAAKSAADEARQRAQAARQDQGDAAGGVAADVARAGADDKVAPAKGEAPAGEQVASLTPEQVTQMLARMAALEALVAGSRGLEGPAIGDTKSTVALAPAAVNQPQHAVRAAGITSAPTGQPIAKAYTPQAGALPDVLPGHMQPRVEGARVLLTKPFYYMDAIRNEGEVLEGYTGPLGSGMVEVDDQGRPIKREAA